MDQAKALSWAEWVAQATESAHVPEPSNRRQLDLAIVILNYNTQGLLRDCLDSVFSAEGTFTYTVCVVDNASTDGSVEMVRSQFPHSGVIANPQNVGFSAGNNAAMRVLGFEADREAVLPRYLLLLNPDTLVPASALARMISFMDENPKIGVAGPRVRRPDGALDRACRRSFPTPLVSFYRMSGLSRLFPHSRVFNAYNLEFLPEDAVHSVDSVVGAYMQVRCEAIQAVGLLDESYFMYGEDLDWAKRVKDAGWEVWYNGQVEITHVKEAASRRSRKARLAFYEAMWIFYRKHYRAETPWWLDKLILLGIGIKGGIDVVLRIWQLRVEKKQMMRNV